MVWKFDPKIPVSLQIVQRLRQDILTAKYDPGAQFPTVRQLAFDASVNPNTMQKALSELEREGLLISRGTVGRFVTLDREILETARQTMIREYIRYALDQAKELGITREMFMDYIHEKEEAE